MPSGAKFPIGQRSSSGKLLVPLLAVTAALAVGFATVAIVLQQQEQERRLAKERELELAVAENHSLERQVQDLQQTKTRLEEDASQLRQELEGVQVELVKAVTAQETLTRSMEAREREVGQLTQNLEKALEESQRLASELSTLNSEREQMQQKLSALESSKNELEAKVQELSARPTVELDKVVVTDTASGFSSTEAPPAALLTPSYNNSASSTNAGSPSNSSLSGQVVVINREYDFVVINLGRNHGLSIGQEFQIVRGGEVLGRAKVEKVYDELSAAAILPESQKDSIQEGDSVEAL